MKKTVLLCTALTAALALASCGTSGNKNGTRTSDLDVNIPKQIYEDSSSETDVPVKVTEAPAPFSIDKLDTFEVTSEDLDEEGKWNTDIVSLPKKGQNVSPQLKWDPVEGAAEYVIYMIDTNADNWLHWKSVSKCDTELPRGWAPSEEYKGPYPPSGTHNYEIYVFALKEAEESAEVYFDHSNKNFFEQIAALDGDGGNVISYGRISGTYSRGE